MCVGKTTVGKALAKELNCNFYDLDWYIEERFHTKVSRMFAEEGEQRFRTWNDGCYERWQPLKTSFCPAEEVHLVTSTTWST